jgi:hypothetical protein
MKLRIVREIAAEENAIVLHGWLRASTVAEFEKAVPLDDRPLRIDLEHLKGADADGLLALLRQEGRGARLTNASPYIDLLLNRAADSAEGSGPER